MLFLQRISCRNAWNVPERLVFLRTALTVHEREENAVSVSFSGTTVPVVTLVGWLVR